MPSSPHRIVILGAGFGGLNVYLALRKKTRRYNLKITLVNKTNYFLFSPLLHEVATSSLGPHHVVEAIRELMTGHEARFLQAEAEAIDLQRRTVKTAHGSLPYDTLVIATGSETNFYGIPGAEHCLDLKTLKNAVTIRDRVVDQFELAARSVSAAERKRLLSFAIIGGGPTGVEMAGELMDLCTETLTRFFAQEIKPKEITLSLLTADPELLMMFTPALRHKAQHLLERRGVTVYREMLAKSIAEEGIRCTNGNLVPAETIIWAAGVKPRVPALSPDAPRGKGGCLLVDPFFRLHKTPHANTLAPQAIAGDADVHAHGQVDVWENVFVLGDAAAFVDTEGVQLPMLAQVAVRQAPVLAKNVLRTIRKKPLKAFSYHSKGQLVSLGRFQAVAQVGPVHLSGPLAWFLWRNTYFWNFPSWNKRIKIAADWFVNLFFPRDISQA